MVGICIKEMDNGDKKKQILKIFVWNLTSNTDPSSIFIDAPR